MALKDFGTKPAQQFLVPLSEAQSRQTRVFIDIPPGDLQELIYSYLGSARDLIVTRRNCADKPKRPGNKPIDIVLESLSVGPDDGGDPAETPASVDSTAPGTRMVVVGPRPSPVDLLTTVVLGAWAYFPLTDSPSSLSVVIRRVHLGECPILAEIAKHANAAEPLLSALGEMNGNSAGVGAGGAAGHIAPERPPIPNLLSKQESKIIAGVAVGAGSGEIARRMGLKEQTVRNYVTEILRKLGARTRAQAAVIAAQNEWIGSFPTTPT